MDVELCVHLFMCRCKHILRHIRKVNGRDADVECHQERSAMNRSTDPVHLLNSRSSCS